jgi:hypothetical protein
VSRRDNDRIIIATERGASGATENARIRFGPHYLVEVKDDGSSVSFTLVATHHGFTADASGVGSELELIIEEVRRAHPDSAVD